MAFNLFKRREAESDTREQVLGDQGTASDVLLTSLINGERLTKDQALTIPAVAANVDLISNCIATMPVKLYKINKKTGSVEEVKDDSRTRLLNGDTGDTLDGYQLKKALVTDYLLDTGGYCYIGKYRNEVNGLYYVSPEYVVINYNYEPIYKSYYLYVGENAYKPYEFIKLLRNTTTGAYGRGIVSELGDALQNAYQTQKYQLGLVKTGGNKRGFLKSERRLGVDEINALKAAWRNLYANNTENVVVLNNGLDFKEAANTSVEMQLNESIDNLVKQIDKIFHISSDFYETFKLAIYPVIKAFETALNRDLLLEKEKGKLFFEFDVKEIVKANIKERYEVYRIAKECGFMTKNEMRQAENMNEIEGLDVVDLGLGAALYDVNTHTYYTPNTDSQADLKTLEEESIIDHDNGTERAEAIPEDDEIELRYNHNHGKDGRFTFGSGSSKSGGSSGGKSGGSSKGSSSKQSSGSSGKTDNAGSSGSSSKNEFADAEEARLNELTGGKLGAALDKTGMYDRDELVTAMKNGTLEDYKNDYIETLRENGDVTIQGEKVTDNKVDFDTTPRESMNNELRDTARANGMSDDEIDSMFNEAEQWFGSRWDLAKTEEVDNFVDITPTYDGVIQRGLSFDTQAEYNAFMDGIEKGSIIGNYGKNTSWTTNEEVARRYDKRFAHAGNDNVDSVMLICDKNATSSAVARYSIHGDESEVLARSNTKWTVTKVDTQTLNNGTKKAVVHVIERTADND